MRQKLTLLHDYFVRSEFDRFFYHKLTNKYRLPNQIKLINKENIRSIPAVNNPTMFIEDLHNPKRGITNHFNHMLSSKTNIMHIENHPFYTP